MGKKFIVCWCYMCLRDGEVFLNCPLKKSFDPLIFPYLVFIVFCLNFRVELTVACWECRLAGEGLLWLGHQFLLVCYITFARRVKKGHLIGWSVALV